MKSTHYMTTAKVGPKGQIVIPKEIREMFEIKPGDNLIVMADINRGIAIQKQSVLEEIANAIFNGKGNEVYPNEEQGDLSDFANAINKTIQEGNAEK